MNPIFEVDLMKQRQADAYREGARMRRAGHSPRRRSRRIKAARFDPLEASQPER